MDAVQPLNYAPKPRASNRAWRWVYRLIFFAAIVIAAVQWGPRLWGHAESIYWEQRCLSFIQPPNHVVFEMDQSSVVHSEICGPRDRFLGMGKYSNMMSDGTIFLHEMRRPDGVRCLVSLTCSPAFPMETRGFQIQYLEWTISFWPQPLSNWNYITVTSNALNPMVHWKVFAGQPDADNPSHFTFDYEADGTRYTWDAWLKSDGQLIVSRRP